MALTPASILADYSSGIGTQGATLQIKTDEKRVGIGTTNPQGTLQVGTAITMGSGIVTATSFDASTATFSGNVSVGGVLTYEDVTNVDSVGIITARSGINVTGHTETDTFNVSGISTLGGNVVVGGATTELVVTGDARVTGILTVGTASLTLNGTTGAITGGSLTNAQVAAISTSIVGTGTTVDVFVYDTSKDSDGGAWRHRTQHTSWYNETLNTSTRGSRKEFPAVAVIVAETDQVTIYDGDDPDLSMWMVFNESSNGSAFNLLGYSTRTSTAVAALNAEFMFCSTGGQNQTYINLISDYGFLIYDSSNVDYYNGNIEQRNDGLHYRAQSVSRVSGGIIDRNTNDVAMTVLPNAPIDSATGLPVTTIAVATNGGISTIKDDGTVASTQRGTNETHSITFDEDYSQIFSWGTSDGFPRHITRLPIGSWINSSTSSVLWTNNYFSGSSEGAGAAAGSTGTASGGFVTVANSGRHFGIDYGTGGNPDDRLVIFHPLNITNNANQNLSAFVTSSYNTGYQHGDIKGAFLSDTDTTNVTGGGDGLITGNDSTFGDTIVNLNWSERSGSGGGWNVSGGVLKTGTVSSGEYLDITTSGYTSGQTYVISYTLANVTGSNPIRWRFNNGQMGDLPTSNGSHSYYVTLTETGTLFSLLNDSSLTADIDNFKLQLVQDEDRSVNNKGLTAYGTITKSPVAGSGDTAADLVAYSGFTGSNYLYRPYSTDIEIGTNDACHMGWFNTSTSSATDKMVVSFEGLGTYGTVFNVRLESDHKLAGWATNDSFSTSVLLKTSQNVNDGVWHHFAFVKSNGTYSLYVDGIFIQSGTYSNNLSYTNNNESIVIGNRNRQKENPFTDGKIALVRFSLSAPTAEQIKKIYEDEKVFFQENAKAILYGSSDLPTALAYDDDEETLYVGTSSGRSDFRGLRRINNTTTAVTTAISASNGLVAEE